MLECISAWDATMQLDKSCWPSHGLPIVWSWKSRGQGVSFITSHWISICPTVSELTRDGQPVSGLQSCVAWVTQMQRLHAEVIHRAFPALTDGQTSVTGQDIRN